MATAVLQPTPAQPSAVEQSAPLAPQTLEETGLTSAFVADLTLKLLYQKGQTSAGELADQQRDPACRRLERGGAADRPDRTRAPRTGNRGS